MFEKDKEEFTDAEIQAAIRPMDTLSSMLNQATKALKASLMIGRKTADATRRRDEMVAQVESGKVELAGTERLNEEAVEAGKLQKSIIEDDNRKLKEQLADSHKANEGRTETIINARKEQIAVWDRKADQAKKEAERKQVEAENAGHAAQKEALATVMQLDEDIRIKRVALKEVKEDFAQWQKRHGLRGD